jgi:hypothetical protein
MQCPADQQGILGFKGDGLLFPLKIKDALPMTGAVVGKNEVVLDHGIKIARKWI